KPDLITNRPKGNSHSPKKIEFTALVSLLRLRKNIARAFTWLVPSPDSAGPPWISLDRKSTRLNSSHGSISYAVFCLKKKTPDRSLVGRLRGSVLLLGPLLARTGRAQIAATGGEFAERRTISTHLGAVQSKGGLIVSD